MYLRAYHNLTLFSWQKMKKLNVSLQFHEIGIVVFNKVQTYSGNRPPQCAP